MTCPTTLPIAFISEALDPPQRVYVRPEGRLSETVNDAIGYITHRRTLGTMTVSVTVRLANHMTLECAPGRVRPTVDWAKLLDIPAPPAVSP